MADWKSAQDPTTGKTYWYHRKTRESRWTKPQFVEEMETNPPVDSSKVSKLPTSQSTTSIQSSRPSPSQNEGKGLVLERDIYRFYGGDAKTEQIGLSKLFNAISEKSFERSLFLDTSIISDISTYSIATSDNDLRWQSLRCLWRIMVFRHVTSRAIQQNTSWKGIATFISTWKSPSIKLLLLAIFSSTIVGDTTEMIPDEDYAHLCEEAKSMYLKDEPLSSGDQEAMNRTLSDISKQALFFSSEQGKKGHVLPSFLLLLLCKYHLSSPVPLTRVIASNIAACLQRIHVAHQVFEESEIAVFAKELLLQCMVKSVDVLEGVLDGFLAMSTDISQTAKALGPSPSTYTYLKDAVSEEELDEAVRGGVFDVKTYHDLPDEAAERFLRDVEWIPKSGVGWQLNSVLLWLRCPALRDLVNDFWQQGGGSHTAESAGSVLELSIDASDEVVETICHYVHYGGLVLPSTLALQLETLKVASELGLIALQDQLENFLCQDICAENLDTLYHAAKENNYRRIENGCVRFMNGELEDHRRQETLQRTLANSIQGGTATINATGQFRSKDLHDFDDVADDVLQGTFNQTVIRGTHRSEHPSTVFGDQLTGSNPSVDYRAMTEEADHYMQSLNLGKMAVVQEPLNDIRPSSSSSHAASAATTGPSKLKSGGIYSLLLDENGEKMEDMYATNSYAQEVAVTGKKPGSATGSKADLASTTGVDRRSTSGGKRVSQLQEYDPSTMSLVPKKEKNEHEKRLEELSRPRSQQQSRKADLEVDTSTNSDLYGSDGEKPTIPASIRSTASKDSFAKTTSSASRPSTGTNKGRPGTAGSSNSNKASSSNSSTNKATLGGRRGSFEDNEPLPDDLYVQEDNSFVEERQDVASQNQHRSAMSAPLSRTQQESQRTAAPLLSSTSNPRLRTSSEPVYDSSYSQNKAKNNTNEGEEGGEGGGGGTQIRSSLALLKAKVSKTGRSRRISAGVAIGSLAGGNDGIDSESSSPVPSSSSAGQLSNPNSLGNTLETRGGELLRQSLNRTGGDRYAPSSSRSQSTRQQPSKYSNYGNENGDDDEDYADDFDAPDIYRDRETQSSKPTAPLSRQASTSRNTTAQDDYYEAPPRSSAAAFLQRLEQQEEEEEDDDYYQGADEGAEFSSGGTHECPDCGRHFAAEPFAHHVKICKKVFMSKRKAFDSSKQRLDANSETLAAAKRKGKGNSGSAAAKANSGASKWKEQSRQFREAMRAARGATSQDGDVVVGGRSAPAQPAQPYIDPTLIQCPNCQRRFSDKAAERHIPICKSIIAKPSSLKKGGGQTAGTLTATQTRSAGGGALSGSGFNGARTTGRMDGRK
jgi:hypothetical protein